VAFRSSTYTDKKSRSVRSCHSVCMSRYPPSHRDVGAAEGWRVQSYHSSALSASHNVRSLAVMWGCDWIYKISIAKSMKELFCKNRPIATFRKMELSIFHSKSKRTAAIGQRIHAWPLDQDLGRCTQRRRIALGFFPKQRGDLVLSRHRSDQKDEGRECVFFVGKNNVCLILSCSVPYRSNAMLVTIR